MTVAEKQYLLTSVNFMQTIQIQLSQKRKTYFQFFFAFLKSILYSKHLPEKDDPHSWCICVDTDSENMVR